ncbi:MAG: DnaJ domain-containing protein [Pseudomonadota bacterium]
MASQLIYNRWFGKAIGFTAAFVVAPDNDLALSAAIIIGMGLGHSLDMWAAKTWWRSLQPEQAFREYLFGAMGKVARNSGQVGQLHLAVAEEHMALEDYARTDRGQAMQAFREGKHKPLEHFKRLAPAFPAAKRRRAAQALGKICAVVPSDHAIQLAVKLSGYIGIPADQLVQIFEQEIARSQPRASAASSAEQPTRNNFKPAANAYTRQGKPSSEPKSEPPKANSNTYDKNSHRARSASSAASSNPNSTALAAAYRKLKLSPQSSYATVTKTYRRLLSRHHPDKLPPTASTTRIKQAEREVREVRTAYETIRASRASE